MNMVRRTLLESPDVTDRVLYAAAVSLEPSIGNLSLKQFQARYPRHVRRFELGQRPIRGPEAKARLDDLSIAERPDLYAPGKDTLIPGGSSAKDSLPAELLTKGDEAQPVRAGRGVRRRVGNAAGNQTTQPGFVERAQQTVPEPELEKQPAVQESDVPVESTTLQPWPLRLLPKAAGLEPPKRPRIRRAGSRKGPDLRVAPGRGVSDQDDASAPFAQPSGSATLEEDGRSSGASAEVQPSRPEMFGESAPPQHQPIRSRSEIRRLLFAWAHELVTAETRGELVGVLARAGEYVDLISNACALGNEQTLRVHDGDFLPGTGSADRDPPKLTLPERVARPTIPTRKRIEDYDASELDALVRWAASDDRRRTDEDLIDAVFSELGFRRRGRRMMVTIRNALDRVRARNQQQ